MVALVWTWNHFQQSTT